MNNNHPLKGHAAIFTANAIFGLGVPVTKALLDSWVTPMGYMASRSFFAALIFWVIAAFLPKERVERKDLWLMMLGGLVGFVASQTLTAWALNLTSPVYFSLIAALTPVAVMLMAALFIGERVTWLKSLGVALGIAGALVMLVRGWQSGSGSNDVWGIILAVLSLLTWAVYLILTRTISQKYTAVTQMKWFFLVAAVITVPWALITEPTQPLYSAAWGWSGVLEMAFIVLGATVFGYFLIPYAMKFLRATTVSIYTNLQPVVASAVAIWLGQDVWTWDKPLAAALVLLGAWLVTKEK